MTFTSVHPCLSDGRPGRAERPAAMLGRNILILRPTASDFRDPALGLGGTLDGQWTPLLGAGTPCRPAAVPARAGRDHPGGAGFVRERANSSRSRPRPCRSRPAMRPICTPSDRIGRAGPARDRAVSAHLAGIRLQEAPGRRRAPDFRVRPRLPQPRARRRCIIPNSPCWNGTGRTADMSC